MILCVTRVASGVVFSEQIFYSRVTNHQSSYENTIPIRLPQFPPPLSFALCLTGVLLALFAFAIYPGATALAQPPQENSGVQFGQSYHNDVSPALRDLPAIWPPSPSKSEEEREAHEANLNPKLPLPLHVDVPDPVVDRGKLLQTLIPDIPSPSLNFDGIPFPGVGCNCAPPDTVGAVGQ